ncbi:MAG: hypothetical protein ABI766_10725 [Gemmatimonadales bacterium]
MRRPLFVAILAGSLLVACSDQPTEPAVPSAPAPELDVGPAGCSLNNLLDLTKALFPPSPTLNLIVGTLKALPTKPQLRLSALIRATVFGIIDAVTKAYNGNKLAGGHSPQTQSNLLAFINGLYCFVGLSQPTIPLGALDPNEGALAVVTPTSGAMTIQPNSKHGALALQARTVPTTTLVAVSFLPSNSFPLLTSLDQYPLFYEFSSSPAVTFTKDVTAAVCLADNFTIGAASLAHNVGTNFGDVEVLAAPPSGTLLPVDCSNLQASRLSPWNARGLFAAVFLPTELHAATLALATTGVGGTTKRFSPFGVVDRLSNPASLAVEPGIPTHSDVAPGAAVSPSPAVVVKSKNGRPIANVPVTFAVGDGGSVNGGSTQIVPTDGNGVATASNWVPGSTPGNYTLTATPTHVDQVGTIGTLAPYKPEALFSPASQTFTATVVGSLGYGATQYRYRVLSEGSPPTGFQNDGFDDSEWSTGDAGFGHNDTANNCPLILSDTKTVWPENSQILLRKRFTLPGGGSTGIVSVAIDNDIKVFVNGVDITSTGAEGLDEEGFARHDGCPSRGSFTFTANDLNPGVNLLVIQGRDRGGSTFVDASVDPPTIIP